jgi:DNA-binding transcriptional MocR family regulator
MIVPDTNWRPELPKSPQSKYKALAQTIREAIANGQLPPGTKLPPVRVLADTVSVTPGTVARAYALLIDENRLEAGVGRGTFVSSRGAKHALLSGPPLNDTLRSRDPLKANLLSPKMPDLGQADLIKRGLDHMARTMTMTDLLNYPTQQTDIAAREAQFQLLEDAQIGAYSLDDIVCTHGGQNAIVMILQTVLQSTSAKIAVDELNYGGFRSAALVSRAAVVGIPWDQDGPIPAAFEHAIRENNIQVFCTSSEVTNPIVGGFAIPRRHEIAAIAERYGVHIIDDDCYRMMKVTPKGPSYRALLPNLGWVVTSPSKSISASLRIGFAVAPQGWSSALARSATFHSFGVSRMVTDLFAYIMRQPELPEILSAIQARIDRDIGAAVAILSDYKLNHSAGVPFLFLALPDTWRAGEFCQTAAEQGVLVKSAEEFSLRDGPQHHAVRIAINGQITHEQFVASIEKLRYLLDHPQQEVAV